MPKSKSRKPAKRTVKTAARAKASPPRRSRGKATARVSAPKRRLSPKRKSVHARAKRKTTSRSKPRVAPRVARKPAAVTPHHEPHAMVSFEQLYPANRPGPDHFRVHPAPVKTRPEILHHTVRHH
jgi:hypothetical protein